MRRRYTIRWNPYPTPLYRRLMDARMWEQVNVAQCREVLAVNSQPGWCLLPAGLFAFTAALAARALGD